MKSTAKCCRCRSLPPSFGIALSPSPLKVKGGEDKSVITTGTRRVDSSYMKECILFLLCGQLCVCLYLRLIVLNYVGRTSFYIQQIRVSMSLMNVPTNIIKCVNFCWKIIRPDWSHFRYTLIFFKALQYSGTKLTAPKLSISGTWCFREKLFVIIRSFFCQEFSSSQFIPINGTSF